MFDSEVPAGLLSARHRQQGMMQALSTPLSRRGFCALLAVATATASRAATPSGGRLGTITTLDTPEDPTILVPGGRDPAAMLATRLSQTLANGLGAVQLRFVGGADGVTAANEFDARIAPDGQTALMLPGAAALAWVAGDARVHFDPAPWIPLLATSTPGALLVRGGAGSLGGRTLRVAWSGRIAPSLAGLLGLDLLGIPAKTVFVSGAVSAAGPVDAVFVQGGSGAGSGEDALAIDGMQPLFVTDAGNRAWSGVPTLPELLRQRGSVPPPAMLRAWRALAAAGALDAALVLPKLSPARAVSAWRQAARGVDHSADLRIGQAAAATTRAMLADAESQLALRLWLAQRVGYEPG